MPWVASSSHTLPHSKQPELTYQIILYLSILGMARDDFFGFRSGKFTLKKMDRPGGSSCDAKQSA
jgi:hypothetical protein